MIDETDLRTASVTKWGFAGLLVFAGAMVLYTQRGDGMLPGDVTLCVISIGLGVALIMRAWWARWLALGVCFLLIIAAVVLPILRFLLQPEGTSSGAVFTNALFAVFMLAFGGIGYRALGYYRSQLGRQEYAGNAAREQRLEKEGSAAIIWSTGAWLLVFAGTWLAGMTLPTQLIVTRDAEADAARWVAESHAADEARRRAESKEPSRYREVVTGPDIAPVGLCRMGDSWVGVTYENRGSATTRPDDFDITYNRSIWSPDSQASFTTQLPPPGRAESVALGSLGSLGGEEGMSNVVRLDFDPDNRIGESDERNNTPGYPISWDIFPTLPACVPGAEK